MADSTSTTTLSMETRKLLALQAIEEDEDADFDETQRRQLAEAKKRAERDMKEAVWRAYRYLILLDKENELHTIDLGLVHSSAAHTLVDFIVRELKQAGEVVDSIGANYLLRNWPGFTEWSTKAVRETAFASPKFPRLLNADSLRTTIIQGVTNGQIAYVGKNGSTYAPFLFATEVRPADIEFSDEMYLITREAAEKYLASMAALLPVDVPIETQERANGTTESTGEETSTSARIVRDGPAVLVSTQVPVVESVQDETMSKLAWSGEIPPLKWMNFYSKVLTRFITDGGVKLTLQMEISPEKGISGQKLEETRIALRELGFNEDLIVEEKKIADGTSNIKSS